MKNIVINPSLELLDPVIGQVRNIENGQVFNLSNEALSLLSTFNEIQDVGDNFENISKIVDCDDEEFIKEFLTSLLEQCILVESSTVTQPKKNDMEISDIALVEKPFYSCLSVPVSDINSEYPYEVAIVGIPFDIGSTGYPGSRFGPKKIREISGESMDFRSNFSDLSCEGWHMEHNTKVCDGMMIVDIGDVIHQIGESYESFFFRLEKVIGGILDNQAIPVSIGGDHSCLYSIVKTLVLKKHQTKDSHPIHLIVFDAHTDLADYNESISHNHGNVVSRLLHEGVIQKITHIGLRGMVGKPFVKEGYTPIYADQCTSCDDVLSLVNFNEDEDIYISFDVDSIDPAYAPGTGTPVPLGLRPDVVLDSIVKIVKRNTVLGLDIVEYNPMLDINNITGNLIVNMLPKILDSFKVQSIDNDNLN